VKKRTKLLAGALGVACSALATVPISPVVASSHREAPMILRDPTADNTDVYMFRDATDPTMVNIIANYVPFQGPQGGPNFYPFGDDVAYEIHVDNDGDAVGDITFQFRFRTTVANPNTFLYNVGPITTAGDLPHNATQVYSVQRIDDAGATMLTTDAQTPPANIGPRSTPSYGGYLSDPDVVRSLAGGGRVFAGQRDDPFFVDLGSVFDLLALRPIQNLHLIPTTAGAGVDGVGGLNVSTIAIQVPIASLTSDGQVPAPSETNDPTSVIGVYASASRQRVQVLSIVGGAPPNAGRWIQVSRLGLPLVNEVLIPLGQKDAWNAADPAGDVAAFGAAILDPEPTRLLPVLYPGVFNATNTPDGGLANRPDIVALLTGGLIGLSGSSLLPPADLLRINLASPAGATFPNGRQLADDVTDIELQVLAGALLAPAGSITGGGGPGFDNTGVPYAALADGVGYNDDGAVPLSVFPYVATPFSGYDAQFYP
jgi:hypothetical protein